MSRKIKQTRTMKIKDPKVDKDSRYAKKAWYAKKKGVFTVNSPFNPINHNGAKTLPEAEICIGYGVVSMMIEKRRGILDEQLVQSKFKVDEPKEENLQSD